MPFFWAKVKNKLIYEITRRRRERNLQRVAGSGVSVHSIDETIEYLIKQKASIARLGDGEINLIFGKDIPLQTASYEMTQHLKLVLSKHACNEKFIVAIPDIINFREYFRESSKNFWEEYLAKNARKWLKHLKPGAPYFNAHVTRLYMDWKDKSNTERWYNQIKKVWQDRDVVIIEGEKSRIGVGNDLLAGAKSIKRILCPVNNAYDAYSEILAAASGCDENVLMLLALGPTATVLAYDLFLKGYQAIDIGHIDIEYCWYLAGAQEKQIVIGKHTPETKGGFDVKDVEDSNYLAQIMMNIIGETERS